MKSFSALLKEISGIQSKTTFCFTYKINKDQFDCILC